MLWTFLCRLAERWDSVLLQAQHSAHGMRISALCRSVFGAFRIIILLHNERLLIAFLVRLIYHMFLPHYCAIHLKEMSFNFTVYIFTNQGSRLIIPTGRSFATNFLSWSHKHIIWSQFIIYIYIFVCYNIWLINACWWTFIIVYSYMVTKVFNIQPFFISIICDLNFVNRNSSFRVLSLSSSRSWCHVLQEKIIVCFAYIYTPFTFKD